jgi:Sodium/hydrogen exchanger family
LGRHVDVHDRRPGGPSSELELIAGHDRQSKERFACTRRNTNSSLDCPELQRREWLCWNSLKMPACGPRCQGLWCSRTGASGSSEQCRRSRQWCGPSQVIQVHCRCERGAGISLTVKNQGRGSLVALAVGAVLVGRVLSVYLFVPLSNRFAEKIPFRWQLVVVWGGLRGARALALSLSLPATFPYREQILTPQPFRDSQGRNPGFRPFSERA